MQAEGKTDGMISLKRRRIRRRGCRGQRRKDDLLSGLYNLGSWEIRAAAITVLTYTRLTHTETCTCKMVNCTQAFKAVGSLISYRQT